MYLKLLKCCRSSLKTVTQISIFFLISQQQTETDNHQSFNLIPNMWSLIQHKKKTTSEKKEIAVKLLQTTVQIWTMRVSRRKKKITQFKSHCHMISHADSSSNCPPVNSLCLASESRVSLKLTMFLSLSLLHMHKTPPHPTPLHSTRTVCYKWMQYSP